MNRYWFSINLIFGCVGLICGCRLSPSSASRDGVQIYAAASVGPALRELSLHLENRDRMKLMLNTAASSTLAQQIAHGAPCDLVLLADEEWMDVLEKKQLIAERSRRSMLGNRLVLIVPKSHSFAFDPYRTPLDKSFFGRLAIGDPQHVPLGRYTKTALKAMNAWAPLTSRLLLAPDARAALLWVERGEAAAGVVYLSDARSSDKVQIVADIPTHFHAPIRYSFAICKSSKSPRVKEAYEAMTSKLGLSFFVKRGFFLSDERRQ